MRDNEKKKLHDNLKQEIRSLLISSPKTKYGGLTGSLLYFDYKQLNCGKEIPYAELGFHSFLALLRSMPDVVRIECKENSTSYRVHPVYDQSTAHIQKMVFEQRDKYEYQNRLYNQNWYSNNSIPVNFFNYPQLSFIHNYTYNSVVDTNFPVYQNSFHHTFNNSLSRPFAKQLIVPNRQQIERNLEPYLLLTPPDYQKQDEKRNLLPCLSSKFIDHNETCSTPNTFLETPPNFDLNDYRLDESIKLNEKDIHEENHINSSINYQIKQIENDLSPITSIDVIPNELPNFKSNQPCNYISNNAIVSPIDNTSITPPIIDEKSPSDNEVFEININENLINRLNKAIRQCIHFRYIHRLCEIKFEYRHYPLSNEILLIKSKLEEKAFNQYQQELKDFEKTSQLNSTIDDQKCQIMFNQYISLQRNYYYMIKLMNKKQR